jgi:protein-tyrosine phosphatase
VVPLVDVHCHLLAGLDDGPRTEADALEMCRVAHAEGVRVACATCHQSERWRRTPDEIRAATRRLAARLAEEGLDLTVLPSAEVMARPGLEAAWRGGELLSLADAGGYLLLEMPRSVFVDLRPAVRRLAAAGVRPVLAHPEQSPELLHEPGAVEGLIAEGCLVQVSSGNVLNPPGGRAGAAALKDWFRRGVVHLLGSDGHSPRRRPPHMADAYRQVDRWAGPAVADRVAFANGLAVARGTPLRLPPPRPRSRLALLPLW